MLVGTRKAGRFRAFQGWASGWDSRKPVGLLGVSIELLTWFRNSTLFDVLPVGSCDLGVALVSDAQMHPNNVPSTNNQMGWGCQTGNISRSSCGAAISARIAKTHDSLSTCSMLKKPAEANCAACMQLLLLEFTGSIAIERREKVSRCRKTLLLHPSQNLRDLVYTSHFIKPRSV